MNEFCDCCEGLEPITPIANANRPGLAALTYRVGTHATFLETMKARLTGSKFPALAHLKTRDANDPSIALLDAWATVADVLTFYQERIVNEGYLRTATERRSVLELARLVGYTPRPGVSATVFPAFMMEIGYNTRESEVPAGTRIQSVPGPGEMPQFFETADKIAARTDWNEIKPRLTRPLVINKDNALLVETVYLKGITTNLRAGDPLLLTFRFETTDVDSNSPEPEPVLRKVATVQPQPVENFTKVTLQPEPLDDAVFLKAFRRAVEKYGKLTDFCIDENSQLAAQILNVLKEIIGELSAESASEDPALDLLIRVIQYTKNTNSDNEEIFKKRNSLFLAVFNLKKFNIESIWLDRLLTELEKLVRAWYFSLKNDDRQIQATDTRLKSEVLSWANWLQKLHESSPQQILDWYLAWSLSQIKYDLIVQSFGRLDQLPSTGENIVIAALIGNSYHVRIFNGTGEKIIDKGEGELLLDSKLVESLNEILENPSPIGGQRKKELINKIISSVDYNFIKVPVKIEGFDSLSEIVTPLSQSPSLPPANRFQLDRNNLETFKADSDLRPRLLETLDPRLGSTLYQTLASDDRVPALSLKSTEATRVKAAPFGHNAPLKPVFDNKGVILSYEEWPIAITSIVIRVSRRTEQELPVSISLQSNAQSESKNFAFSSLSETVPVREEVNGVSIQILGNSDFVNFTFDFSPQREFIILLNNTPSSVRIDRHEWSIFPGETLRDKFNGRQVIISASVGRNDEEWSSISILDESLAPVSEQNRKILALDAQYDQIQPGSQIAIVRPNEVSFHQVINTRTASKTDYGISGRVTQLTLDKDWLTDSDQLLSDLRGITIYAQGEALDLAEEPLTSEPVCGQTIELGTIYEGLKAGRWLIVSGDRVDVPNTKVSELVMLAGVQNVEPNPPGSKPYSTLTLSTKLAYVYKRDTVKIYGNVVKATHGETRVEVLGSGDGSQAFQQFLLRQPPLTYLASPTPSGAADTLEVRVNDVLWHETDSLADLKPTDRLYTLKTDDNGMTTVIFGNGENGARLPTGIENVRTVYRNGIGKVGNVKAEQINLLATRPLGLKGVINPLPASGGADRENRDRARENAPLAVMALDRLVSLQDYEDFSRTFAGIGKASAQKLPDGTRQIVHVTIAGADDIPIDRSSDLYRNLKKALHDNGDFNQPIRLAVRKLVLLILAAKIRVLPDYQWEVVEPQIRAVLLDNFGFERRNLGQGVWLSDIISIIQQVRGVAYVDVDLFDSVSEDDITTSSPTLEVRELLINGTKIKIQFNQETNNLVVKLDGLANKSPSPVVTANLARFQSDPQDPDRRIIAPTQLAIFSPKVADTMILTELKP